MTDLTPEQKAYNKAADAYNRCLANGDFVSVEFMHAEQAYREAEKALQADIRVRRLQAYIAKYTEPA